MSRALLVATIYFVLVFAVGFGLGTVRVMLVVPWLGAFAATLIEIPLMLAFAFFGCRWLLARWQAPPVPAQRWAMALWFLGLLALFEWQLGILLFGRTAAQQWALLASPAGMAGLGAQLIAALMPVIQRRL
jgi:hypothetical protein